MPVLLVASVPEPDSAGEPDTAILEPAVSVPTPERATDPLKLEPPEAAWISIPVRTDFWPVGAVSPKL
jgi:hypothetical protein